MVDSVAEAAVPNTLTGVARILVHSGKLQQRAAEEVTRLARDQRRNFVAAAVGAGALSASEMAHTLSTALSVPLLDLDAVDPARLPQNLVDARTLAQYQVLVLGKRGNRIFIGGSDPTDQEAVDRIKFATQLTPEWVIVEQDKLGRILEGKSTSATEALENIVAGDFDFDVEEQKARLAAMP